MRPRTLLLAIALVFSLAQAVYAVESETALDTVLQNKWAGLKEALQKGDVPVALGFIAIERRPVYEKMFTELAAQLPTVGADLGDIRLLEIRENVVEYELLTVENGKRISYYVEFIRDTDGVWRLRTF